MRWRFSHYLNFSLVKFTWVICDYLTLETNSDHKRVLIFFHTINISTRAHTWKQINASTCYFRAWYGMRSVLITCWTMGLTLYASVKMALPEKVMEIVESSLLLEVSTNKKIQGLWIWKVKRLKIAWFLFWQLEFSALWNPHLSEWRSLMLYQNWVMLGRTLLVTEFEVL